MRVGRVYAVDWLDSCEPHIDRSWFDVEDIDAELELVRTVGYVVLVSKRAVVMAHSSDGAQCSLPFSIPKAAIVRTREVKLPPLKK